MKMFGFVLTLFLVHFATSLNVTVYYETLCPDSIHFITKELYPNYYTFSNLIDVNFVPYGFAQKQYVNNTWFFQCQHGEDECFGNKYHACALHQDLPQDTLVDFVYCSMSAENPAAYTTLSNCAAELEIPWEPILQCYRSQSDEYLSEYGDLTEALTELNFIPTIVFDGKYSQELEDDSLEDFFTVVCGLLEEKQRPEVCGEASV